VRTRFVKSLVEIGKMDKRVYLITGDVGGAMFNSFREACPGRHIEFGIAEQTMVGFAAGMAMEGLRPIVYTITPFLLERAFEQIKLDVDTQNVPVGLVGYSGYPTYGPSHTELDADGMAKMFRNIQIGLPASEYDVEMFFDRVKLDEPWLLCLKRLS
jgi:transketolase